jgi:rod shape-determining protein MreC
MESVLGRYRNLIILVVVLFLQVLGLAVQVKRGSNETQDTRLIRIWAVDLLAPFERALVRIESGAGNIFHNYFYLRGVRAENRQLKEQIEQMRLEQVRLSEDAAQARRLQSLLAFKEQFVAKTVAAQVIGTSGSDSSRVVYIDKGENAGIARDMAVMTADGVVGKVLMVYPSVAQVLLINDQTSGVGVILGNTRLQGVLAGTVNGEVTLNGIMSDEQVPVGENVLTSGGDQIFPKGLPVGTVTKVGAGKDLFLNIRIKPAADLSKLEEVLVLVEKQERQATADSNVRVRAADILAQRLPSVPDKPADANAPGAAAAGTKPAATNVASSNSAAANPAPKAATGAAVPASVPSARTAMAAPNGASPVQSSPKPTSTAPISPSQNSPSQVVKRPVVPASGQPAPVAKKNVVAPVVKPVAAQAGPAITEEKPGLETTPPRTPPPASDNSPN